MRIESQTPTVLILSEKHPTGILSRILVTGFFVAIVVWIYFTPSKRDDHRLEAMILWSAIAFVSAASFFAEPVIDSVTGTFNKATNAFARVTSAGKTGPVERRYSLTQIDRIWISQSSGRHWGKFDWSVAVILKDGRKVWLTPGYYTFRIRPIEFGSIPNAVKQLSEFLQIPIEKEQSFGSIPLGELKDKISNFDCDSDKDCGE